jgi:hypothetical protein
MPVRYLLVCVCLSLALTACAESHSAAPTSLPVRPALEMIEFYSPL